MKMSNMEKWLKGLDGGTRCNVDSSSCTVFWHKNSYLVEAAVTEKCLILQRWLNIIFFLYLQKP